MYIVPVNILAVVFAAVAMQAVGFLWYSPKLFGKQWIKLLDMPEEMPETIKKEMGKGYLLNGLGSLITSYVLAIIVANLVVTNLFQGIQVVFYIWVGFIVPVLLSMHIFSYPPKPWALYLLNVGYFLASLLAAGIIITLFVL